MITLEENQQRLEGIRKLKYNWGRNSFDSPLLMNPFLKVDKVLLVTSTRAAVTSSRVL